MHKVDIEVGKQKHIVGMIIYIITALVAQRARCSNHALLRGENAPGILNVLCILPVDLPSYALPPGSPLLPLLLHPFFEVTSQLFDLDNLGLGL